MSLERTKSRLGEGKAKSVWALRGAICSECQNVKSDGARIAYFRAGGVWGRARAFSCVGEKAECKSSGVFPVFCFAFMSNRTDRCG